MSVLISLVVCVVVGLAGLAAGWALGARRTRPVEAPAAPKDNSEKENLANVMATVKSLTENIAFDVEEHNESMQQASADLRSAPSGASGNVMEVLAKILHANEKLQKKLESAEQKLMVQAQEIQSHVQVANTDALTSIANRRAFDKEMAEAAQEFKAKGTPSCVMMMDVDHFKKFNDTHGHQAGDEVLKHVARTLRVKVKKKGLVCRYGGEEFAVIYRGSTIEQCLQNAEMARAAIGESQVEFEGKVLKVKASAGLAQLMTGESYEAQVKRADDVLYMAKEAGRNQGFYHNGKNGRPFVEPTSALLDSPAGEVGSSTPELNMDWAEGMSTKDAFKEELKRRVAEWKRGGPTVSLAVLKVDNWFNLITTCGDEATNLILKATTQFLKASVRDMDNISNYGDGKFAMLFPSAKLENTQKIGERLRSAISRCEVPTSTGKLNFTVSVSVTELNLGDSTETIIERCDHGLSHATKMGGNLCFAHDGDQLNQITKTQSTVS